MHRGCDQGFGTGWGFIGVCLYVGVMLKCIGACLGRMGGCSVEECQRGQCQDVCRLYTYMDIQIHDVSRPQDLLAIICHHVVGDPSSARCHLSKSLRCASKQQSCTIFSPMQHWMQGTSDALQPCFLLVVVSMLIPGNLGNNAQLLLTLMQSQMVPCYPCFTSGLGFESSVVACLLHPK